MQELQWGGKTKMLENPDKSAGKLPEESQHVNEEGEGGSGFAAGEPEVYNAEDDSTFSKKVRRKNLLLTTLLVPDVD